MNPQAFSLVVTEPLREARRVSAEVRGLRREELRGLLREAR